MEIYKPYELLNKEVYDKNEYSIGIIDKIWNSWNQIHPGPFFGIKIRQNIRDVYFRGTYKLIPIYGDYIEKISDYIKLNITIDELNSFWNKTIQCGYSNCTTDDLLDKPVYDKNHSRVGTFFTSVDSIGPSIHYGIYIDPYLCDIWKTPKNTLMPIPTNYITYVDDTITLDKTLEELKKYWKEHYNF